MSLNFIIWTNHLPPCANSSHCSRFSTSSCWWRNKNFLLKPARGAQRTFGRHHVLRKNNGSSGQARGGWYLRASIGRICDYLELLLRERANHGCGSRRWCWMSRERGLPIQLPTCGLYSKFSIIGKVEFFLTCRLTAAIAHKLITFFPSSQSWWKSSRKSDCDKDKVLHFCMFVTHHWSPSNLSFYMLIHSSILKSEVSSLSGSSAMIFRQLT